MSGLLNSWAAQVLAILILILHGWGSQTERPHQVLESGLRLGCLAGTPGLAVFCILCPQVSTAPQLMVWGLIYLLT